MMGYGGGDLLRTGAVWPAVGLLPRPVCAGCGQWPVWPAAPGPWRKRIRGGLTAGLRRSRWCTIQIDSLYSLHYLRFSPTTVSAGCCVVVQKALKEKQEHVEQLLKERDLERSEFAKTAAQIDDVGISQISVICCWHLIFSWSYCCTQVCL